MVGECDPLNAEGAEMQPEIQLSKETKLTNGSQASSTSHIADRKVVTTFKDVLGVTEEKELLDKIEEVNINISNIGSAHGIKIRNVPEIMLRNKDFKKYFKPRELSIGPSHAADPSLFKRELKLNLVAHYVERRKRSAKFLLGDLKVKIKDIKTCYKDEVIESYDDVELIWLLFLDGCAMLEFIHSYVDRRLSVFGISNGQAALIQQDLFFLENQIPLLVLEVLMGSTIKWPCKDNLQNDIFRFIFASNISNFPRDLKDFNGPVFGPCRKPVHVLDLLRYVIVIPDMASIDCEILLICLKMLGCCGAGALFNCYRRHRENFRDVPEDWIKKQSFRNVQELKTAGIKFKTTQSLREISLRSRFFTVGQLKLPTFVMDNSTPHMLFNLVA